MSVDANWMLELASALWHIGVGRGGLLTSANTKIAL